MIEFHSISGLAYAWPQKLLLASLVALLLELAAFLAALYGRLFTVDPILLALVLLLLVADLVTGILRAHKQREPITSRALRRTGRKFVEYVVLIFAGVGLANGFAETSVSVVTSGVDDAVLLYIALTEFLSILENVTGSREGALGVLRKLRALQRGDVEEALHNPTPPGEAPR
ncbi:MAG: phage holin family protein [Bacteroidota bacterium]